MPPPLVLAYRVVGVRGLMARDKTHRLAGLVNPVFTAVHVSPLSMERKTPAPVPAYRVVGVTGSMTTLPTTLLASPVFTAVQVVPLLTERKMPPKEVPAYRVVGAFGSISRERTS